MVAFDTSGRDGYGADARSAGIHGQMHSASQPPHMSDRNRPLYMIGVAAELAGVHPQTLRAYEQKGLVTPQRTRGGTRMYSQADIERLALINELTAEGINLAGVMRILDLESRLEASMAEAEDLHKRVRRLAERMHEMASREGVSAIVHTGTQERSIVVRRIQR